MGSIRHQHADIVYSGESGTIDVILTEDDKPIEDYTPITRVTVHFDGLTIDSSQNPDFFDWTSESKIIMQLGQAGIPAGSYHMRIKTYDASNMDGLTWTDQYPIVVK